MFGNSRETTKLSGEKGFTLVEIMLVLVVASIAFLAIYALFANTIKYDLETRYELIASNLAQEGVEIMRNMRDENQMRGAALQNAFSINPCRPYFDGVGSPFCDNAKHVDVKYTGTIYKNCDFGGCGLDPTTFSRDCTYNCDKLDPDGSGDCIQITVKCIVAWDSFIDPNIPREAEATSVLTSWQD